MFHNRSTAFARLATTLCALASLGAAGVASAQNAPRSFVASPDIYKVVAQNDESLVIEVTWKPGQRDEFHSHTASGIYYLTGCSLRWLYANGITRDLHNPQGAAFVVQPIPSHAIENIGNSDCKLIMFEPK